MGLTLFPWQDAVVRDLLSRDKGDRPACVTAGISVPRQNGKNAILEAVELYYLVVCGWHVLHTAHRVKTVKKAFQRLVKYFTDKRHTGVMALVSNIRRTNGEEAIYLENGGSIEFSARTNGGGRGFDDIQLVVYDEAQALTDAQLSAIMYTLSASSTGERMMIYTGTPPDDKFPGTVFGRVRDKALTNPPRRSCWYEWGVTELPPADSTFQDLLDLVYETNPSMGRTLDEEWTENEFGSADIVGFATERLGWWRPVAAEQAPAIPAVLWDEAAIEEIGDGYRGKVAFGVKFSPDGSSYALAGCKLARGRGKGAAVELVELGSTDRGTKALAEALWERRGKAACVVVDGMGGADALCGNLSDLRCPRNYVVRPRTSDVIAAAQLVEDGLRDSTLAHSVQPALEDSAKHSVRRPIGSRGGWGFGSTETHDSMAIEAVSLALWGARNSKRDPRRKQVMR